MVNIWKNFKEKSSEKQSIVEYHCLSEDSWIKMITNAVVVPLCDFDEIWNNRPRKRHKVVMYGNEIEIPRTQILYGKHSYTFTGATLKSESDNFPDYIQKCMDYAKRSDPETNWNGALVNFYKDGSEYIGAHSDSDRDMKEGTSIYSFSFGGERTFRIRDKSTKRIVMNLLTKNNSLIIMGGDMQKNFTHEIVKTKKPVGRRINVTIREFEERDPDSCLL